MERKYLRKFSEIPKEELAQIPLYLFILAVCVWKTIQHINGA